MTGRPPAAPRGQAPLRGIAFVIAGVSIFSLQDSLMKTLSARYPLLEVGFVRSLVSVWPLAALAWWERGRPGLWTRRPGLHLARGSLAVVSFTSYYLALAALPLAELVALYFAAPLFLALLSQLVLGERVLGRRWAALLVGFAGVLIVLRPGTAVFEPAALLALFAAVSYAASQTVTRELGRTDGAATMALATIVLFLVVSAVGGLVAGRQDAPPDLHPSLAFLVRAWTRPPAAHLGLMALCGLMAGAGAYCLAQAYRAAPAASVAPFEYVMIVWAVLWGYVFWGDVPGPATLVGIAMTVGAGLVLGHREARDERARRRAAAGPAPAEAARPEP